MTAERIRIGTRGSALALAQARLVAAAFEAQGRATRLVTVETEGDRRAPDTAWGEGAFVAAIERALLDDRVDAAVHSAKDVPTDEDARLRIAAYLPREDPADVLVVRDGEAVTSLADLPAGARVGTDSPRRQGFLLAARRDLHVHPLHGNVDTRLRRLDDGETDALVLAAAGLRRLGREERIAARLDPETVPPAAGQGAIAVQVRAGDARMLALTAAIDDVATRAAVEAERRFLAGTGGGCRAPVGVLASGNGGSLRIVAGRVEPDGSAARFETVSGDRGDADALVDRLLERLLAAEPHEGDTPVVLVTRPGDHGRRLAGALAERGLRAVVAPTVSIAPPADPERLVDAFARHADARWVVVTSANGASAAVESVRAAALHAKPGRWVAIGPATAAVLRRAGIEPWLPSRPRGEVIGEELPLDPDDDVLLVRGNLADDGLAARLIERGARVSDVEAYRTVEAPEESRRTVLAALRDPRLAATVIASPSAARGLLALAGDLAAVACGVPAICAGATTAAAVSSLGFAHVTAAERPDAEAVVDRVVELLAARAGVPA